jgi:hypothetical protein
VGVDRSITRFHSPCRGAEAPPQSTCRSSISAKVGRDLPLSQEDSSRCRVRVRLQLERCSRADSRHDAGVSRALPFTRYVRPAPGARGPGPSAALIITRTGAFCARCRPLGITVISKCRAQSLDCA